MGSFIHCPSCGAPASGQFCAYCGTPLFTTGDTVNAMRGRRCHIWVEMDDGTIQCMDIFVNNVEFDTDYDTLYVDDRPYMKMATRKSLAIEADLVDLDMDDWAKVIEWQSTRYSAKQGENR